MGKVPANWQRQYFEGDETMQATLTDEQAELLAGIKKLESEMIERKKHFNYTIEENDSYREETLFKLQQAFYFANQAKLKVLEQEAAAHKADYLRRTEKDAARNLLELHRYENRYGAMSKADLDDEVGRYLSEEDPEKLLAWNPDRLDALQASMVRVSGKPDEMLSGAMIKKRAREPWRNEKPAVYKARELYESEYGTANLLDANGEVEKGVEISRIYMEGD